MHKYKLCLVTLSLSVFLASCESPGTPLQENAQNHKVTMVDELCQKESINLKNLCMLTNAENLDVKTLKRCNWFLTDQASFLEKCNKESYEDNYFFLYFMTEEEMNSEEAKIYWEFEDLINKKSREECEKRKIIEMTFEEFETCKQYLDAQN